MPDELQPEPAPIPPRRRPEMADDGRPAAATSARPSKDELRSRLREILPTATRPEPKADEPSPADSPEPPPPTAAKPPDEWLAWDKPDAEPQDSAADSSDDKKKRRGNRGIPASTAWIAAGAFAVVLVVTALAAYGLGGRAERAASLAAAAKEGLRMTPEFEAKLDAAFAGLRDGRSKDALDSLTSLELANPTVASLSYLIGLAAMQNGDFVLSERKLNESIAKRERISDSLAVLAALEGQKVYDPSFKVMGDARMRAEIYLRRAMMADAANPFPMIELASLLRSQKKADEALALLKSSRPRLNPVDSHTVVDTTIALLSLEKVTDADLPPAPDPAKDIPSAFSAAYIAMRKSDFSRAAGILTDCRSRLAPDLYNYLVFDPALAKFSARPELAGSFKASDNR